MNISLINTAKRIKCPECGTPRRKPCHNSDGTALTRYHVARLNVASKRPEVILAMVENMMLHGGRWHNRK